MRLRGMGYELLEGYLWLRRPVSGKNFRTHRLVLAAFVGKSELQTNHKNLDKIDNRLVNLEYVTRTQNMQHAIRLKGKWQLSGEKHGQAKVTAVQVKQIRKLAGTMTQSAIALKYGLVPSQISHIINKRQWKNESEETK